MPGPMWRQIAEDLRNKIESGEIGGGSSALPTELELQEQYNASRNTIRDAVKWLVTRGLVYTRSGQGTFVVQKVDPFVTTLTAAESAAVGLDSASYLSEVSSRQRKPEISAPRVEIQQASGLSAAELKVPVGTSVVTRQQRRFIDGLPYSMQTTFYPMQLVERGATRLIQAEDIAEGAVSYLRERFGIDQVGWRQRIKVRVPDADESGFFGLPDDGRIAVFEIIRTGYDARGTPLRVTVTTYPTDRNEFVMTSGSIPEESAAAVLGAETGKPTGGHGPSKSKS